MNSISSYPFENVLRLMKLKFRSCNKPLEQIARRISEINSALENPNPDSQVFTAPKLKFPTVINNANVFQMVQFEKYCLSSRKFGDKWFLAKNGSIVEFNHAAENDDGLLLHGNEIKTGGNFFTQPFSSSNISIFVSNLEKITETIHKPNDIRCKMICLSCEDYFVLQPLLHTLE